MNNKEPLSRFTEKASLEYLQEIIRNSPEGIAREYATTPNPWLACFVTRLTVLMGRMQLHEAELKRVLTPERYQETVEKLSTLDQRVRELKEQYSNKETDPPENIKQELLQKLNIF